MSHSRPPLPSLPSLPFPYVSPPLTLHSPSPPSRLEVAPLNTAMGSGSAVSSPSGVWGGAYRVWGSAVSSASGVWGGAPAEIEFGAF